jgi:hypothetical protein
MLKAAETQLSAQISVLAKLVVDPTPKRASFCSLIGRFPAFAKPLIEFASVEEAIAVPERDP